MKRSFFFLFLAIALVSCTAQLDPMTESAEASSKIYAAVEGCDQPMTKVYADTGLKVLWNADDRISMFDKTTYNYQYKFLGNDGDASGEFEKLPASGFITGNNVNYYFAIYPYNKKNKLNNDGTYFTVTLPAEQTWKANSFGVGANTMVAASEDKMLLFKNVGGYLSLRLYGKGVSVSQIILQGNSGEPIAGKATVAMSVGGTPVTTMDNTATGEISLVCEPAVELGATAEQYTDFWFVVPPVTFTKGFTVMVMDSEGNQFTVTTGKSFTVVRSQLDWMNPLEVVME
ncbi:MAG: hypothetical protein IJU08_08170 [Bacteroidales bacterium]|nr:hypothetical protein [Bacteroidales bacterium]